MKRNGVVCLGSDINLDISVNIHLKKIHVIDNNNLIDRIGIKNNQFVE